VPRQIILASRPSGWPTADNFALAEAGKRLTLRGFIIIDHQDRMPGMVTDVSGWLREGKIAHAETIVDGLDRAPGAFIDLLRGANTGKMLVRL
jgi:NADPH-dependent curcumin reductase CurA